MLKISHRHTIFRASILGSILIATILAAAFLVINHQDDSIATTKSGDTVTVKEKFSRQLNYGTHGTHYYEIVTAENKTFDGYCAQPDNSDPVGTTKASGPLSGQAKYNQIKLAIFIREHPTASGQAYTNLFNGVGSDSFWGSNETQDIRIYVFTHAVIGAIYDKDYEGLDDTHKKQIQDAKSYLQSLIQDNSQVWQKTNPYRLFRAIGNDGAQDIVWIEPTGSITVQKCDAEITSSCIAQGNANFDGITFTVYKGSTAVASKTISGGANSVTFNDLDVDTTYTVKESGSNASYDVTASSQTATPTVGGVTLTFHNTIKRGNLTVNKIDKDTGACTNSGSLSFAGTTFQIINNSANSIFYQNTVIGSGGVITTKTLSAGECSFSINNLPYGSYAIKETAAAPGYALDNTPKIVNIPTGDSASVTYTFENQPVRGNIKFTKMDNNNEAPMANTIFSISSLDSSYNIKETHIVVADQNGVVDTSANPHTRNTNGYDALYNDYIEEQIVYSGFGTWFGLDKNGNPIAARDGVGALPYGTYLIQELKCDANMFCTDIINQKKTVQINQHNTVVDLGNWDNTCAKFTIETQATDGADGDKYIEADSKSSIKDKVSYCAKKNVEFTIKGVLMDKATGEKLLINDQPVEQSVDIKPTEDCGEVELVFNIDSSNLAGKEIVVFEYLYYKDDLVTQHEDINDEAQTVDIISLKTIAVNNENDEKVLPYDADTVIKDVVQYCLKPNQEYTIKGVIMDKATKSELLINEKPVEQEITITPEEACGEVTMLYPLNTTDLAGSELIIFESLYLDDQLILEHKDFDNESESISVAPIPVPDTGFNADESKGDTATSSSNYWLIGTVIVIIPVGAYFIRRAHTKRIIFNK